MNILLIGIQGCGKGTLVAGLEKHIDFSLISMGQLLRDEVATGSELGKKIHAQQTAGQLVDIDIVVSALNNKLKSDKNPIKIFDGFPRSLEQAEALDRVAKVDLIINLNLPKEIAVQRLLNRLTCSKCGYITKVSAVSENICPECGGELVHRSDDTMESINKRFEIFEKETYPLIARYKNQGVRVEVIDSIDANETLDAVLKVLNECNN